MKNPMLLVIPLWWVAFAGCMVLSWRFPGVADSGIPAACFIIRLLIPLQTRAMHWASVVLLLAAMLLALRFSSASSVEGLLALLCLAAYFLLIIVSDILEVLKKTVPAGGTNRA